MEDIDELEKLDDIEKYYTENPEEDARIDLEILCRWVLGILFVIAVSIIIFYLVTK